MQTKTKQRLIGSLILLAILLIFLPMVFHNARPLTERPSLSIPPKPTFSEQSNSHSLELTPPSPPVQEARASTDLSAEPIPSEESIESPKFSELKNPPSGQPVTSTIENPEAWCVQIGTFNNANNVNRLIKELRKEGFDAYTHPVRGDDGEHLLRVYVGPEVQKARATEIRNRLENELHLKGIVRKYTIDE